MDDIYNPFAEPVNVNYIEIQRSVDTPISWITTEAFYRFYLTLDLDQDTYSRSDYNFLQCLGDIGGIV